MNGSTRRSAFTLIELLIVIVGMTILAGILVPQVEGTLRDATESAMLTNLYELTGAIERYKMEHSGRAPDVVGGTLPQLTSQTNASGEIGTGAAYRYGPYMLNQIPANPLNGSATVKEVFVVPPPNPELEKGWLYHPVTGQIWPGEKR